MSLLRIESELKNMTDTDLTHLIQIARAIILFRQRMRKQKVNIKGVKTQ